MLRVYCTLTREGNKNIKNLFLSLSLSSPLVRVAQSRSVQPCLHIDPFRNRPIITVTALRQRDGLMQTTSYNKTF